MEKFGDMLEAAAETAIPAAPNTGGQSIGPSGPQEWGEWDDEPFHEFMIEEVGGRPLVILFCISASNKRKSATQPVVQSG